MEKYMYGNNKGSQCLITPLHQLSSMEAETISWYEIVWAGMELENL